MVYQQLYGTKVTSSIDFSSLTNEELKCIAIIFSESSTDIGKEVTGKAIACVVMNRMNDNYDFREYNSVLDIVTQKSSSSQYAFNGLNYEGYYNARDLMQGKKVAGKSEKYIEGLYNKLQAIAQVVLPVIRGIDTHDITGGALFYNQNPSVNYKPDRYENCNVEGYPYDDIIDGKREKVKGAQYYRKYSKEYMDNYYG